MYYNFKLKIFSQHLYKNNNFNLNINLKIRSTECGKYLYTCTKIQRRNYKIIFIPISLNRPEFTYKTGNCSGSHELGQVKMESRPPAVAAAAAAGPSPGNGCTSGFVHAT